jgi:hypothetical protein
MNPLLAKLFTLLALAQVAVAAPGLVLCIEPWGEVRVEAAAASDCCPEDGEAAEAAGPVASEGPACGCVDVALDTSATSRGKELAAELGAQVLSLAVEFVPASLALPAGERPDPGDAPRPGDTGIALVGTIVLLV